ncbi:glucosaminidase domain-containing protein [Miltoncostaea oceani]|uniref:glucosaminidase domain-containing protein n=1 Tax=Miltoncostaea oceani TaxID=2843216 RepID=UPI001C3D6738|nr:glucosaminidase domain-containing protein [Miltoncostaea oceani]
MIAGVEHSDGPDPERLGMTTSHAVASAGPLDSGYRSAVASPDEAGRLDEWMLARTPDSPLVGLGEAFVRSGRAHGISPAFLVAVARHESLLGTAGPGAAVNNAFGWGPHLPFASWEENIETVAKGLSAYYLAEGRESIVEIAAKWAPIGAGNDPAGLNANWVAGVSSIYRELGGDPGTSVALAPRTRLV